ncbi:hypothetical protein ACC754_43265, partial [Rhizobium johnstonii]
MAFAAVLVSFPSAAQQTTNSKFKVVTTFTVIAVMRNGGTERAAPFTPAGEEADARDAVGLAVAMGD